MNKRFENILLKLCNNLISIAVKLVLTITPPIEINNRKVYLPWRYKFYFQKYFITEKYLVELINNIVAKYPGDFIDIGVNIGQTLAKVKSTDFSYNYYGIEPSPACHFYVNKLIKANKYQNCSLIPCGLSNKRGFMVLASESDVDVYAHLAEDLENTRKNAITQIVAVATGDFLIESLNIKNISILKIDVEGGELEVVEGFQKTISELRPFILCEILPPSNAIKEHRKNQLLSLVRSMNYDIYRVCPNASITPIDNKTGTIPTEHDYIFIPSEQPEIPCRIN